MKKPLFIPDEPVNLTMVVGLTLAVLDDYLPEKKDLTTGKVQTYTRKQIDDQILRTMSRMKVILADFGFNIDKPLRIETDRTRYEN